MYSQHTLPWYLDALNGLRRLFGREEKHYMTDYEWKRYMDSNIPQTFWGGTRRHTTSIYPFLGVDNISVCQYDITCCEKFAHNI